jgi:hypothetical protein
MALVLADRVKETTTTTGTGTLTLAGAATGFQSFSVIGNGNTTYYAISSSGGSQWEVGIGTYTSSGTTLARTTIIASSNGGSAVNLSAGTKDVFVTYPSGKSVNLDASGNATALGTLASAILTNATGLPLSTGITGTLPVANGGTGSTALTANNVILGNGTSAVQVVAPSTSGNVLTSNGTTWVSSSAPGGVLTNTQTFTSSGTYTKPSGASWVQVTLWGGGGSGGASFSAGCGAGGGGGMYFQQIFPASSLSSTVTVTIGAGGAGVIAQGAGNDGGNTTFGAYATAFGGKKGSGGGASSGGNGGAGTFGGESVLGLAGKLGAFDAGGGGGTSAQVQAGGASLIGGGGGGGARWNGSAAFSSSAGGVSSFGGSGGAGSYIANATAGTQPSGGGGGLMDNAEIGWFSGAGGDGKVIVYTW